MTPQLKAKLWSVAKGAMIAAAGAALAYGAQAASTLGTSADLGVYGPVVAALLAVAVNALRQAMTPDAPPAPTPTPPVPPPSAN